MRYRSLGESGLLVSVVGLGCNNFGSRLGVAEASEVVDAAKVEALIAWAQAHDVTILHAAIGALAAQPGCSSVIAGAMNPEQVKANAEAGEWIPSAAELAEIDEIVPPPDRR